MKFSSKKAKKILKITGVVFITAVVLFLIFRNSLLNKTIEKISSKIDKNYNSTFKVNSADFDGLTAVKLTEVSLVPKNADTLFSIQEVRVEVDLMNLLWGEIQLEDLSIKNGFVQLIKKDSISNYQSFLKQTKTNVSVKNNSEAGNYAKATYRIINKLFNLIPTDMQMESVTFRYFDGDNKVSLFVQKLALEDEELTSKIHLLTSTNNQILSISGLADPRDKEFDLHIKRADSGSVKLPYLDYKYGLKSSFDSIKLQISDIDKGLSKLHINGDARVYNFVVKHKKIAQNEVVINKVDFDFKFLLGSQFVSLDSTSTLLFNKIKLHPHLVYDTEEDTVYQANLRIPKMKAQDFVTSLPLGLFSHFQGMKIDGNFKYDLNFKFNKNKPSQLVFESNVQNDNMKIVDFGESQLNKMNSEFSYRAIENGMPQRAVWVGYNNPFFTPLSEISPYLQKSVLTSEDPSFFYHKGFINEAFKQSIIKNIRTKKFSRGASTISMQLVKNVFLTRDKTMSRKLEEILLVYLLENNRITSKSRMLEVYFNVIEWGPNVYGIGEAANFYFNKRPNDLTLKECLFLATIVPSPKRFARQFDNQAQLSGRAIKRQKFLINLMLRRGLISETDTIGYGYPMNLYGRAINHIQIKEIEKDSLHMLEPIEIMEVEEEFNF